MVLTSKRIMQPPLLSAIRGDRNDYCSALFVDAHGPTSLAALNQLWVCVDQRAGLVAPDRTNGLIRDDRFRTVGDLTT